MKSTVAPAATTQARSALDAGSDRAGDQGRNDRNTRTTLAQARARWCGTGPSAVRHSSLPRSARRDTEVGGASRRCGCNRGMRVCRAAGRPRPPIRRITSPCSLPTPYPRSVRTLRHPLVGRRGLVMRVAHGPDVVDRVADGLYDLTHGASDERSRRSAERGSDERTARDLACLAHFRPDVATAGLETGLACRGCAFAAPVSSTVSTHVLVSMWKCLRIYSAPPTIDGERNRATGRSPPHPPFASIFVGTTAE